jgi:hypothetical protein
MDLSGGVDLTNPTPSDQKTVEWENWEEEHSIELFELQLRFDGLIMGKFRHTHACPLLRD